MMASRTVLALLLPVMGATLVVASQRSNATPPTMVDLTAPTLSLKLLPDRRVKVSSRVANEGNAASPARLVVNGSWGDHSERLASLDPGEIREWFWVSPPLPPGDHLVALSIQPQGNVFDRDESNNVVRQILNVPGPNDLGNGRRTVRMPSVVGMTRRSATRAIVRAGLRPPRWYEHVQHSTVNRIERQWPEAGGRVSRGTTPVLVVGAQAVVPQITGLSIDKARDSLRLAGLEMGPLEIHRSRGHETQRVLTQEPSAGSRLPLGAGVRLAVVQPQPMWPLVAAGFMFLLSLVAAFPARKYSALTPLPIEAFPPIQAAPAGAATGAIAPGAAFAPMEADAPLTIAPVVADEPDDTHEFTGADEPDETDEFTGADEPSTNGSAFVEIEPWVRPAATAETGSFVESVASLEPALPVEEDEPLVRSEPSTNGDAFVEMEPWVRPAAFTETESFEVASFEPVSFAELEGLEGFVAPEPSTNGDAFADFEPLADADEDGDIEELVEIGGSLEPDALVDGTFLESDDLDGLAGVTELRLSPESAGVPEVPLGLVPATASNPTRTSEVIEASALFATPLTPDELDRGAPPSDPVEVADASNVADASDVEDTSDVEDAPDIDVVTVRAPSPIPEAQFAPFWGPGKQEVTWHLDTMPPMITLALVVDPGTQVIAVKDGERRPA